MLIVAEYLQDVQNLHLLSFDVFAYRAHLGWRGSGLTRGIRDIGAQLE
jgi:hypothetical protein